MRYVMLMVAALMLTACNKEPETTRAAGVGFKVETLFTVDGCTVYRFADGGYKYFTNCKGTTEWSENCGKACTREVSIGGGK